MKITVIICTKDRPKDIATVLTSLQKQTYVPNEIIIVDGSDNPVEHVVKDFMGTLPIKYHPLRPPGLARQRNFGISQVDPTSEWVGFLDDDLVLDPTCLQELEKFLQKNKNYGGTGLCIYEQVKQRKSLLREIMLIDKYPGGCITKAGCPATIRSFDQNTEVEWLYGGATFWKLDILKKFKYDEWFSGVGYFEDVDFSYRVSRGNKLAVCAGAKCHHYHHEVPMEKMGRLGEWLVVAWWYFATVKNNFNPLAVIWGIGWMTLNNLLYGMAQNNMRRLKAFQGNLKGLRKVFGGEVTSAQGFQK